MTSRSLGMAAALAVGAAALLYSACRTTTPPTCGNGALDPGERCDPNDPDHPCPGLDCSACSVGLVGCDGGCVDPQSDRAFCGASADCAGANAGQSCGGGQLCAAGRCATSCPSGQLTCGGQCVNPLTDRSHCGATGDCAGANGGVACDAGSVCNGGGACALSCQPGLLACAGRCVDPSTDRTFCGASGDCLGANVGATCDAGFVCNGGGRCALSCQPGFLACAGRCIDPSADRALCGASGDCLGGNVGATCDAGFVCSNGACAPSCGFGTVDCNGACVDPQTNRAFCGASGDCQGANAGTTCDGGSVCASGVCGPLMTCSGTEQLCGVTCTDVKNDPANCGTCGHSCPDAVGATGFCSDGGCLDCPTGFADCNNDLVRDGCETGVLYNRFSCGACGNFCSTGVCDAGSCRPAKFVFVSSTIIYGGTLGGAANADVICQNLATDAGLPGTYLAWLTSAAGSPSSRFTRATIPYALVDGTVIANDWTDLTDSSLMAPINKTEHNRAPPLAVGAGGGCGNVYTGTWPDGTRVGAPWECSQWTDAGSSVWGRTDLTNFGWSQWCSGGTCAVPGSLYCFQQ